MSERELPLGEDRVPDKALEELYAAFAGDAPSASAATDVDFDDPSIDALLGLEPNGAPPAEAEAPATVAPAAELQAPGVPGASVPEPVTPVRETI